MRGGGDVSRRLKKAIAKALGQVCGFLCRTSQTSVVHCAIAASPVCRDSLNSPLENQKMNFYCKNVASEVSEQGDSSPSPSSDKNLCAICLDPLNNSSGSSAGHAIFTAQCSHAFHFACISSNVRHGNVTCPICRAQWTQLPLNKGTWCLLHHKTDPALQMVDNSIANPRVRSRSFRHSAGYYDNDTIEPDPDPASDQPRLRVSILNVPYNYQDFSCLIGPAPDHFSRRCPSDRRAFLHVKLSHQPGIDLVLVATPCGPHLRLMRQAMAMTVFSLRPMDRLAIVTYSSSTAARVFPLRHMTSCSKKAALQVIDRLFYSGQADPTEGLTKGVKILADRIHKNLQSCILHLTDCSSTSYHWFDTIIPVPIHRFHVGYSFHSPGGHFLHEFEEFLARTIGGRVQDLQLRIGEERMVVNVGELRGGEERSIPVCVDESGRVRVEYRYRDKEHIGRSSEWVEEIGDEGSGQVVFGSSMIHAWQDDGPNSSVSTEFRQVSYS